jgi:hypothetical protein
MKNKLLLCLAAMFGLTVMGLQGCYDSGPGYYPGYGYSSGYYSGPAYRSYGSTVGSCNPRNGACEVCDSEGHHCHAVYR